MRIFDLVSDWRYGHELLGSVNGIDLEKNISKAIVYSERLMLEADNGHSEFSHWVMENHLDLHMRGFDEKAFHCLVQNVPIFLVDTRIEKDGWGGSIEHAGMLISEREQEWRQKISRRLKEDFNEVNLGIYLKERSWRNPWKEIDGDWVDEPGEDVLDKHVIVDLLGMHCSGDHRFSFIGRRHHRSTFFSSEDGMATWIIIFVDKVAECCKDEKEFRYLFAKVLVHELMHEFMTSRRVHSSMAYNMPMGKCWEELFANALTLYLIMMAGDGDLYKFARQFVMQQPWEYAMGGEYFDNYGHEVMCMANNYVSQKLEGCIKGFADDWVHLVAVGDWDVLENLEECRRRDSFFKFEGRYEYFEDNVILAVLRKWVGLQQKAPTFEELNRAFPMWTVGKNRRDAFALWKGVEDSDYLTDDDEIIQLADAEIVVAQSSVWEKDDFVRFAEAANKAMPNNPVKYYCME